MPGVLRPAGVWRPCQVFVVPAGVLRRCPGVRRPGWGLASVPGVRRTGWGSPPMPRGSPPFSRWRCGAYHQHCRSFRWRCRSYHQRCRSRFLAGTWDTAGRWRPIMRCRSPRKTKTCNNSTTKGQGPATEVGHIRREQGILTGRRGGGRQPRGDTAYSGQAGGWRSGTSGRDKARVWPSVPGSVATERDCTIGLQFH